jgi:hypothetical protein
LLGAIRGITTRNDSILLVLDRDWAKVVIFEPNARVARVILGGRGSGPREFRLPVDLRICSPDTLAVLDYTLGRVDLFSLKTDTVRNIRLQSYQPILHIVCTNTTIWGTSLVAPPDSGDLLTAFDMTGRVIQTYPMPHSEVPWGSSQIRTTDRDGRVLLAAANPGVWYRFDSNGTERVGFPIYPNLKPPVLDRGPSGQLRLAPAQAFAVGIGAMPSGDVIIFYARFPHPFDWNEAAAENKPSYHAAIFPSAGGPPHGTVGVPVAPRNLYVHVSPVTGHVFLSADDPYPRVVEYAVTAQSRNPNQH